MATEKVTMFRGMMEKWLYWGKIMLLWLCLAGCERKEPENDTGRTSFVWLPVGESCGEAEADTETEQRMREYGLVDIREMDSTVFVYLVYARANNFIGKVLYPDIRKAFMLPETAKCLTDAHRRLKVLRPELRLLIYDAARPMHVQEEMWKCVRGTDKRMYVSNPANGGGLHNYGAAVDVTLADADGMPLPMGSPFDYFGEEARPDREEELVKQGKLILPHLHNRRLLRRVMTDAGFKVLSGEWWHFNLFSREEAKKNLRKIEIRNKE